MDEQIKVLRIIARMNIGGPAFQIAELLTKLGNDEFDQKLIFGACKEPEKEVDFLGSHQKNLIKLSSLGRGINPIKDLIAFISIRRMILNWKPMILHTHTAKAGVLGRLAAYSISPRPKVVHTFHGHLLKGYFPQLVTRFVIFVERTLALGTNRLIAVGRQVRDDLLDAKIGNANQYEVIPPGISMSVDKSESNSESQFNFLKPYICIVWIGRLTPIKNPMMVLDLAQELANRYPNLKFVMVGDGELKESLDKRIKSEGLPVIMLGWQTDIFGILNFATLVIQTSLNEGTPLSLIQAQMAGIPVISTKVGSISEIVDDGVTGDLVEASVFSFRQSIEKYLNDSTLRKQASILAKRKHLEANNNGNFILHHQNLYRELCNRRN